MKNLEKFLEKIKKLKNYDLLHTGETYVLLGHPIHISLYIEMNGNMFMPYTEIVEKDYYVCFKVFMDEVKRSKKEAKDNIPCLAISSKFSIEEINEYLNKYIASLTKKNITF